LKEPIVTQSITTNNPVPRNTLAPWALVLGITGLVLSLVVVGGLFGLVAILLGGIATARPGRKGMATVGVITGGMSVPISLIAAFFWLFFLIPYFKYDPSVRRTWTIAEISNTKTALELFKTDVGRFPTTAENLKALITRPTGIDATWKGPYLTNSPTDKWGRPFVYRCPGTDDPSSYDLLSIGPDAKEGTADDISKRTEY
jgi:general secretion pathway protein G